MIGRKARERAKFLSKVDEIAFKAWAETGSLDKTRLYFEKHKILHDDGKQYSVAGIRFCAMRYMTKNYEEAITFLTHEYEKRGMIPNVESIEVALIGYAVEVLKYKRAILEWAAEHGLLEKYRDAIEERTQHAPMESRRTGFVRKV